MEQFESVARLSFSCFSAMLSEEAGLEALNTQLVGVARERTQSRIPLFVIAV